MDWSADGAATVSMARRTLLGTLCEVCGDQFFLGDQVVDAEQGPEHAACHYNDQRVDL